MKTPSTPAELIRQNRHSSLMAVILDHVADHPVSFEEMLRAIQVLAMSAFNYLYADYQERKPKMSLGQKLQHKGWLRFLQEIIEKMPLT